MLRKQRCYGWSGRPMSQRTVPTSAPSMPGPIGVSYCRDQQTKPVQGGRLAQDLMGEDQSMRSYSAVSNIGYIRRLEQGPYEARIILEIY
jgi:hypothetical protein